MCLTPFQQYGKKAFSIVWSARDVSSGLTHLPIRWCHASNICLRTACTCARIRCRSRDTAGAAIAQHAEHGPMPLSLGSPKQQRTDATVCELSFDRCMIDNVDVALRRGQHSVMCGETSRRVGTLRDRGLKI